MCNLALLDSASVSAWRLLPPVSTACTHTHTAAPSLPLHTRANFAGASVWRYRILLSQLPGQSQRGCDLSVCLSTFSPSFCFTLFPSLSFSSIPLSCPPLMYLSAMLPSLCSSADTVLLFHPVVVSLPLSCFFLVMFQKNNDSLIFLDKCKIWRNKIGPTTQCKTSTKTHLFCLLTCSRWTAVLSKKWTPNKEYMIYIYRKISIKDFSLIETLEQFLIKFCK